MRDESSGPIEQEIVKEENFAKTPKAAGVKLTEKLPKINLRAWLFRLKRPKFATLAILLGLVIIIYLGLLLLKADSQQQQPEEQPQAELPKSTPQASSTDPNLSTISQRVNYYSQKIDSLDNFQKELERPIVNLEIDFEK